MLAGSRCLFRRCPASSSSATAFLASSISATASPANIFFPMALPGSSISATAPPLARAPRPATSQHSAPASNIFPMALRHGAPASNIFPMALRHGAPASSISATAAPKASNKPHSAEKYSGLASNLAHLDRICQLAAAVCELSCTYLYICVHPHCCHLGVAAQTDANLSAHLHRLPTPPTYLRRMRLPPGQGRRCLVLDEACRLTGVQVLDAGYGCRLAGGGVPANHRARESLF